MFALYVTAATIRHVADDYLYPQLYLQRFTPDKAARELTYYHRVCDASTQTAHDTTELIVTDGFRGIFIYIGIFIAYWLAVPHLGFMVTTPFVMLAVAVLLGGRSWIPIITMSVITPVLIYYGSREFLRVYLPTWTL
ncbi:tripartite tricarboxylate transporter TctB family protein [Pontibacterium sp.]|uniref:tripartite tricarboxylate transporter TctB family protein n=1 Tax=Pontibacterium sp. TaxID=2036026 RepID=UPI00356AF0AA